MHLIHWPLASVSTSVLAVCRSGAFRCINIIPQESTFTPRSNRAMLRETEKKKP